MMKLTFLPIPIESVAQRDMINKLQFIDQYHIKRTRKICILLSANISSEINHIAHASKCHIMWIPQLPLTPN